MNQSAKKIFIVILIFMATASFLVFHFSDSNLVLEKTDWLRGALQTMKNEMVVFAQYFYPHYPQRIIYIVSEMSLASKELVYLNEGLAEEMESCDCRNTQSQCISGGGGFISAGSGCSSSGVFGDPCQNREKINEKQAGIKEKTGQISYLRNLLLKEKELGLKQELETLDTETATELKNQIDAILATTQEIFSPANANYNLPADCLSSSCVVQCQPGGLSVQACVMIGTGAQKQINANFDIGAKLDDLDLGQIGIKNINLSLPEEIDLSKINDLTLTVPGQELVIGFPETTVGELQNIKILDLSSQSVDLATQASLPQVPELNLSCQEPSSIRSSYQCSPGSRSQQVDSIENRWYYGTFSFLSEACQLQLAEVPASGNIPTGQIGQNSPMWTKLQSCLDPEKLPTIIPEECEPLWNDYCDPEDPGPEPPPICWKIKNSCDYDGQVAQAKQCQELFNQLNEPVPSSCQYSIRSNDNGDDVSFPFDFNPVATLQQRCQRLKDAGLTKDPPEPCKVLPLFTGIIEKPKQEQYSSGGESCQTQNIGDFPSSLLSCPPNPPTLPKITFPKIIVPDIVMPYFRIWPFLEVKLPSLIFEDLVLPDFELCNLDDCKNIFPYLQFHLPTIDLPSLNQSLKSPDLDFLFQGIPIKIPLPDINANIQLPPIPFNIPQLAELNLGNLLTPELQMPQITLPKPQITFSFAGIDYSAIFTLIPTFVLNALDIPDINYCLGATVQLPIPFKIIFPDYFVSWPSFPTIPEIPFCKETQSFCRSIKTLLKEVTDRVAQIESFFNQTAQTQIQNRINQANPLIKNAISNQTNLILQQYSQIIREKIREQLGIVGQNIGSYVDSAGRVKLPPVAVSLPEREIVVPLADLINLPDKITIPWPQALKKITLTQGITYDLPDIPLNNLSFQKRITIPGPGFQPRTVSFTSSFMGNWGDCNRQAPTGGNTCPNSQFQSNLEEIQSIKSRIDETSSKIIDILE